MMYTLTAILTLAVLLFQARGTLAQIFCEKKMRAGDYDGALRRLRWISLGVPSVGLLHKEALILSLAGRPADAERRYRTALGMVQSGEVYPRERLYASLGYAVMDLGRYDEAEHCFHRAIEAGDATGNSQDGLAELRLAQGVEADKALSYSRQAMAHSKRRADGRVPGVYYAHEAWALALLGRREEAGESLAQAMRAPVRNGRESAALHWRAGMVQLEMDQTEEARKHFQIGRDADPRGKYGRRCGELLLKAA